MGLTGKLFLLLEFFEYEIEIFFWKKYKWKFGNFHNFLTTFRIIKAEECEEFSNNSVKNHKTALTLKRNRL